MHCVEDERRAGRFGTKTPSASGATAATTRRRSQFPEEGPATTGGYAPAPALAFPEPTPAIPPVDSTPMPTRQMDLSAPADDAAFEILFKREQHRTEAAPVTYREYIFAIASGTSETAAEEFLRGQLRRVQGAIEAFPTGKIVNLAAVDGHVDGKPTGRPLATLSWKDWRGSVVVEFPKRRSSKAPSRPPSQLFSQPPTHPSQPPPPRKRFLIARTASGTTPTRRSAGTR